MVMAAMLEVFIGTTSINGWKKTIAMFGYLNIPEGISFVPC
jgi:hypothetical protein